jgi:hypothetical protein
MPLICQSNKIMLCQTDIFSLFVAATPAIRFYFILIKLFLQRQKRASWSQFFSCKKWFYAFKNTHYYPG